MATRARIASGAAKERTELEGRVRKWVRELVPCDPAGNHNSGLKLLKWVQIDEKTVNPTGPRHPHITPVLDAKLIDGARLGEPVKRPIKVRMPSQSVTADGGDREGSLQAAATGPAPSQEASVQAGVSTGATPMMVDTEVIQIDVEPAAAQPRPHQQQQPQVPPQQVQQQPFPQQWG